MIGRFGLFIAGTALWAQSTTTRGIVPEEVVQARPAAVTPATVGKPKYQPVAAAVGKPAAPGRQIGVTIWRLRSATAADAGARILVQEESQTQEWIPERISSTSLLKPGDKVRLSIESPETGCLYVIDREQYLTGSRGEPYLIFPTKQTNGGNNEVSAGRLVDIPAQSERPNFFFAFAVSRGPIRRGVNGVADDGTDRGFGDCSQTAAAGRGASGRVGTEVGRFQAERVRINRGGGAAVVASGADGGRGQTRALTQDDPQPQTVYRVVVKPGGTVTCEAALAAGDRLPSSGRQRWRGLQWRY